MTQPQPVDPVPDYDFDDRIDILRALGSDADATVHCLDEEFSYAGLPRVVAELGLRERGVADKPATGQVLDEIAPDDQVQVMAVAGQARSNGAAFCVAHFRDDDTGAFVPAAVHIVNMLKPWGVLVCVRGGSIRPIEAMDAEAATTALPRRIVQHRDRASHFLWIDDGSQRLMGWDPEELIGQSSLGLIEAEDHERGIESWLAMLSGQNHPTRIQYVTAGGESRWFELSYRNLLDDPERGYVEVEMIDVHEEMLALARARSREEQFETLTESLPVGVVQFNADGEVIYANRWVRAFGPDLNGVHAEDTGKLLASIQSTLRDGESVDFDARLINGNDGTEHRCHIRIRPLELADKRRGAIASVEDMTELLGLQADLERQAHTDYLTGLANRAALMKWLDRRLDESVAEGRRGTTLIFFDLDGFKRVNDGLGHDAGDKLLQIVAARIGKFIRPGDLLARIGGDEFVIAYGSWLPDETCASLAERVLASFDEPIVVADTPTSIGCSIGLARSNEAGASDSLLENADIAMYEAKRAGGSRWSGYHKGVREKLERQFLDEGDLRRAMSDDEFVLYLQPIVDLDSGLTVAAEALIRWNHPIRGLLGPGNIIAPAERSGLIHRLGRWIVEDGCRLATRAAREFKNPCRISINISGHQLMKDGFQGEFQDVIEKTGTDPSLLILEVTETSFIETNDATMFALADLAATGATIALDDFGTGFSSLNHLRLMRAQMVKIDGSYTADLGTDRGTTAITEAMVGLTKDLGQELVVEGIEEAHQLIRLRSMGVNLGQGFLLARPMPEADFFAIDQTVNQVEAYERNSLHT